MTPLLQTDKARHSLSERDTDQIVNTTTVTCIEDELGYQGDGASVPRDNVHAPRMQKSSGAMQVHYVEGESSDHGHHELGASSKRRSSYHGHRRCELGACSKRKRRNMARLQETNTNTRSDSSSCCRRAAPKLSPPPSTESRRQVKRPTQQQG